MTAASVRFRLTLPLFIGLHLVHEVTSPQAFWRHWHISLSTWLRDYLYIPLGGNRHGTWRTQRNLMLTMVLGGLWHGAAWPFVLWGVYQGGLLIVYRQLALDIVGDRLSRQEAPGAARAPSQLGEPVLGPAGETDGQGRALAHPGPRVGYAQASTLLAHMRIWRILRLESSVLVPECPQTLRLAAPRGALRCG